MAAVAKEFFATHRNLARKPTHIRRMTRTNRRLIGALLLGAPLLVSCGGSGEGLDENGRPGNAGGGGGGSGSGGSTLTADLQSIQDHVFTPICTACHAGAAAPLGFRLDAASAYAMLVNAPSVEVPSLRRVSPGNPDSSYLIQKLEGHAAVGGQMPLGQNPLPQATIDVIRQWITNGAANVPAAAGEALMTLNAVTPVEDEILTRSSAEPLISASGAIQLSTINATNLIVERSASGQFDGSADTTRVQGAQLNVRSQNPTVFSVMLPQSERVPGNYRITLRGTGPTPVLDSQGRPISDFTLRYTIEDIQ
jgi:hypothetical protein